MNDSKILNMVLDTFTNNLNFEKNNNLLLADSGYDSNIIRDTLVNLNFGQLLVPRNKNKLANYKLTPKEKIAMKNRINAEHTFQNIRYDKSSVVFLNYVILCTDYSDTCVISKYKVSI